MDMIADHQECDTWKIQLRISINIVSQKGDDEERVMYSKSNNIIFTLYNNANKVVHQLFESILQSYEDNLETSIKEFILF